MITTDYINNYLKFYPQINLIGLGTLFKDRTAAQFQDNTLFPQQYSYKLDGLESKNIDHFVLYVSQKEPNKTFEELHNEILGDMKHMDSLVNSGQAVTLDDIGTIKLFNNKITLFESEVYNKWFGYPNIKTK